MSDLEVQQYLFDVQGQKLLFSEPADPHRHFPSLFEEDESEEVSQPATPLPGAFDDRR